ncbi:hypothetical protein J6590_069353 [Homalodisca vitripennis]|nr:hypothetical protein J6590_069353 [Homalodisca vitripennis]
MSTHTNYYIITQRHELLQKITGSSNADKRTRSMEIEGAAIIRPYGGAVQRSDSLQLAAAQQRCAEAVFCYQCPTDKASNFDGAMCGHGVRNRNVTCVRGGDNTTRLKSDRGTDLSPENISNEAEAQVNLNILIESSFSTIATLCLENNPVASPCLEIVSDRLWCLDNGVVDACSGINDSSDSWSLPGQRPTYRYKMIYSCNVHISDLQLNLKSDRKEIVYNVELWNINRNILRDERERKEDKDTHANNIENLEHELPDPASQGDFMPYRKINIHSQRFMNHDAVATR